MNSISLKIGTFKFLKQDKNKKNGLKAQEKSGKDVPKDITQTDAFWQMAEIS